VSHRDVLEACILLYCLYGVVGIDIHTRQVYQDYLLGIHRDVRLAELGAVFESEVELRMRHTHVMVCEIVQERVVVVVTLDHYAVDVLELEIYACGVRQEEYSFLCRGGYQKSVISDVMRGSENLNNKAPYLVAMSA